MMKISRKNFVLALSFVLAFSAFAQAKPDALKEYRNGNYAESIKICEQELVRTPQNMDSYTVLCWALLANKQYRECEQRATQARKIYANDVRIIEVLAESKFYLDKNDESLKLFQRYIELTSQNAERAGKVYYFMGEIYVRQGKYQHADISFSMATQYEQNYYWYTRLGYSREKVGDYSNALVAYEKALKLNPTFQDALNGKKNCQVKLM